MASLLDDVAKLAGVSLATASLVMNNSPKISPETSERVRQAAEKLNYIPNARARDFARKYNKTIALIIPDMHNLYFAEIAQAIKDYLRPLQYHLILCDTNNDLEQEREYITYIKQGGVDGAIFACSADLMAQNNHLLMDLSKSAPVVLLERTIPGDPLPTIDTDRFQGAKEATRYLISLGHRKIAFIGGYLRVRDSESLRFGGYKEALLEAGVPYDSRCILDGNFTIEGGYSVGQTILSLEERPTAVMAGNDLMAIGLINSFSFSGLKVPDDISVCAFDDLQISKAYNPALTTVHISKDLVGRKTAELLLSILKGIEPPKERIIFPTELMIRKSAAALRDRG